MKYIKSIKTSLLITSLTILQLLVQLPAKGNQWSKDSIQLACETYETNKFEKKREVEGDWTPGWADDISETDVGLGVVAAGVSIYDGGSSFTIWVENLVQRTISSLGESLSANAKNEATKIARQVISDAIRGESGKEIVRQFDKFDFKAGAIRYTGFNRDPIFCQRLPGNTWGMKPYVMFRISSSIKDDINLPRGSIRLDGHNIYKGGVLIDNNPKTIQVIEGSNGIFQLHNDGQIWKWLGKSCDGNSCPHWVMIDNNPATKKIITEGSLGLFQLHNDGKIWQWKGQPCNGGSCPHWAIIDNNPSTIDIFINGDRLLQQHNNGQQWEWLGEPCTDWCRSWKTV